VIQSKSETGHRSIRHIGVVAIRKEGSLKVFPCYFFEVQIGIIRNVWFIVKMPRAVKRISVYRKNKERERYDGKDYYTAV